ncbi:RNA polymerase sigma factor [candidate division KSB1 bacterium]|nr:MAG: RNA polymerase sigma factor [candidate division KSB1 bacterium]MCE7942889.1 RNA polymerase sigma factor [Chlorobi bacterium CHB1]MDL1873695.1 RNA polymerase sigma factor [Cytophagia bacterium CHB2]
MMEDEVHLIRRLQSGESSAFRELVENHKRRVVALAFDLMGNLQDAEDVSQEALMKVYHGIRDFRGEAQLSSWMYRIVVNICINRRRKKAVSAMELRETFEGNEKHAAHASETAEANPELTAEAGMIREHLRAALDHLSPQQRSIFIMRHDQDMPLQQISEILKISEGTVKSQLFRALRKLQKQLAFYRADLGIS